MNGAVKSLGWNLGKVSQGFDMCTAGRAGWIMAALGQAGGGS